MKNSNVNEILNQLNEYFKLLSKLNNLTYHNLQRTKKIIIETSKNGIDDFYKLKEVKIHLYTLELTLEEIKELINNMESKNE